MVEITINTVLYAALTLIVGLAISLLLTPSKNASQIKEEIKASTAAFDDLVKSCAGDGNDDWLSDDEDEGGPKGDENSRDFTKTTTTNKASTATTTKATPTNINITKTTQNPKNNIISMPTPEVEKAITKDKHGNLLPFQVGDRVILQKLSVKELNGKHGYITHPGYSLDTLRYPVDLDLLDLNRRKKPTLSVKVDNLKKESTEILLKIPDCTIYDEEETNEETKTDDSKDDDKDGATKKSKSRSITNSKGCLIPHHAKAASFIWDVYRKSVVGAIRGSAPPGTPPPTDTSKIAAFGWSNWKPPPSSHKDKSKANGFYEGLQGFLCKGILAQQKLTDLDKQVSPDSSKPKLGAYKLVTEAMQSQHAVKSWNVRVEGDFWIVKSDSKGTYCAYVHNPKQVYLVQGYQFPLAHAISKGGQIQYPRPPKFYLCLVAWYGQLIYDPFVRPTTGTNQVELASPQLTPELIHNVKMAEVQKRVITSLKQVDVSGGSLTGLPYQQPQITPPAQTAGGGSNVGGLASTPPNAPPQAPASEEERILVDNLTDFPNVLKPPQGMWSILPERSLGNEIANDNSMVILSGNGTKLGQFTLKSSEFQNATAVDYLQGVLNHCSSNSSGQSSDRPSMIGVTNMEICHRLQFLIHGKVPNLRIVMLQVKKKPPPGSFAESPPLPPTS